jgi:hypothetical protein
VLVFRYIAALIIALEGIFLLAMGSKILNRLSPSQIHGASIAEMWFTFALSGAFYGVAAYQMARDRPRTMAWITSGMSAVILPGWFRIPGSIPLVFLISRLVAGRVKKSIPVEGANVTAQPAAPGGGEGSAILETVITLFAFFLYRLAWSAAPDRVRPTMPEDAHSWSWIAFGIALTASTFFHELGHAVGGYMVRFRLVRFLVYPFDFARTSKNRYFKLNFKMPLAGMYLGFPEHVENLEARFLWMTACGPLGGILYSFVCWTILLAAGGRIIGLPFGVLYTSMTFCLVNNLLNLLPLKSGAMRLDGRVLWDAVFDRTATSSAVALLGCASSLRSSLRPRDWPEQWVEHLRLHSPDLMSSILLSQWAEDRLSESPGDPEARADIFTSTQALGRLAEALKGHPQVRNALDLHRAWLCGRYAGTRIPVDLEAAGKDKETEPYEILRLQAALLAAEGDTGNAMQLLLQAETSLKAQQKSGIDAANLDSMRVFREELMARLAPTFPG